MWVSCSSSLTQCMLWRAAHAGTYASNAGFRVTPGPGQTAPCRPPRAGLSWHIWHRICGWPGNKKGNGRDRPGPSFL
uniref:Putative secreted protein n=1 Tax=Anopheles darlingi TaxID=43151 RepID=A0A2M4DJR2_ANODA